MPSLDEMIKTPLQGILGVVGLLAGGVIGGGVIGCRVPCRHAGYAVRSRRGWR